MFITKYRKNYIMEKVRKFVSATSVIKYLKNEKRNLSTETLYNYLDFCKSVYLFLLAFIMIYESIADFPRNLETLIK